jgi:nucleoside-triphosphatase THEP1
MGKAILSTLVLNENGIVIIDEVGLLELRNRGWADCINELLDKSGNHILITVRTSLIDEVVKKWNFKETIIFNITETDYLTAGASISGHIKMT